MSKQVARDAMLLALALIFSYVETLIPLNFGIPGVKLGIANLIVVSGLYYMKPQEVISISILRVLLVGFLFGNGMSVLYSLAGGVLSFFAMLLTMRIKGFSIIGVSIAGGVCHNIGQILVAAAVVSSWKLLVYLPVLLVAGTVTGALIGLLSKEILPHIKTVWNA